MTTIQHLECRSQGDKSLDHFPNICVVGGTEVGTIVVRLSVSANTVSIGTVYSAGGAVLGKGELLAPDLQVEWG